MAPEAKTDIAIARNAALAQRPLVGLEARRDMRKPILLMFAQTIGFSMPTLVEHVEQRAAGSS